MLINTAPNPIPMPIRCCPNEKGMVLVVALLLITVLTLIGTTAIMTSSTDIKISTNYRQSSQAFYSAEAGSEHAMALLRTSLSETTTISTLLEARLGTGRTVLTDSANIENFYSSGAFVTPDVPFIADTT